MGNGGACAVHALPDLGRNDLCPADGSSRGIRPVNVFHHMRSVAYERAGGSRKGKSDFSKRVILGYPGLTARTRVILITTSSVPIFGSSATSCWSAAATTAWDLPL